MLSLNRGLIGDGSRVFLGLADDDLAFKPIGPNLELLDGARAERIARGEKNLLALLLITVSKLSNRGGLANPVDAANEQDGRPVFPEGDFVLDGLAASRIVDEHRVDEEIVDLLGFGEFFFSGLVEEVLDEADRKFDADVGFDEDLL